MEKQKKKEDESNKKKRRQFTGKWKLSLTIITILLSGFQLYTAAFGTMSPIIQRSIHLSFILFLVFMLFPATKKSASNRLTIVDGLLMLLSTASTLYITFRFPSLVASGGLHNNVDIVVGAINILLVIEAARRAIGKALPILAIVFIVFAFIGRMIPGPLKHSGFDAERVIQHLYLTTEGIYGQILGVSSTYIYLFILFGAFLSVTGMSKLFNDIALALAGHTKGGPAKVSVISSAFMGSISGSTSANVVTTGSFTIPLMKKIGFRPHFAGGVEASASAGGQIMPPVMGAAAFIMSDALGIPFVHILGYALIPAILYFAGILITVHLRATKLGMEGLSKDELPSVWGVLKDYGHLLAPIIGLIYMLIEGYNAMYAGVWGILLAIIFSSFRKHTRINVKDLIKAMVDGALNAIPVASACAIIGIIIGVTSLTGAILAAGAAILDLSGGFLITTLLLTMVICILIGMELPTTANYILTSAIAAPAIILLGIEPIYAHFFVFYFGILSTVTPPVAIGAYAAAGLAGSDPIKTGVTALRLAIVGFIIPYMFIYSPDLMISPESTFMSVAPVFVTALIGVFAVSASLERYLLTHIAIYEQVLLGISAFLLISTFSVYTEIAGIVVFLLVLLNSWRKINSVQSVTEQKAVNG
ncbi:TRAP transporter permease [Alkalihalobacillus sp. AL-G]|uniref:TRAP transporter permease n=1 Tax=Alkalihalobacillus sp. AL-G TaxID=2926399 RepID=UPI002729FFCE|nr:TRAP transporter permease [Alkalihalobacillus sp. AL-G]WLD93705.1 TRAP transporter permease [Alkalihalobacillus sp. AL-G]